MQKKVIEIKLNAYVPINDNICIDSTDHDQVYDIKFHGKPVKIQLRTHSITVQATANKRIRPRTFVSSFLPRHITCASKDVTPIKSPIMAAKPGTAIGINQPCLSAWTKNALVSQ